MRPLLWFGFLLAVLTLPAHGEAVPPDGTAIYSGVCAIPGGRLGARIFVASSGTGLVIERFRGTLSRRDPATKLVIDRAAGRISFSVPEMAPVDDFPARDWRGTISDDAVRLDFGDDPDPANSFVLTRVQTPGPPYPACKRV